MITDNENTPLFEILMYLLLEGEDDGDIYSAEEQVKELYRPKLKWEVKDITSSGGDVLVYNEHRLLNYDIRVVIHEAPNGLSYLFFNGTKLITSSLDNCKEFCTNKILNDFLKLCQ